MTHIIDNDTGEVINFDLATLRPEDYALQADTELMLVSERALDFTKALIEDAFCPLADVSDLRGKTKALHEVLSASVRGAENRREAQNNITEARLRLERYAGGLIPEMQAAGLLARKHGNNFEYPEGTQILADYQITRKQSSQWQKYAQYDDALFEEYVAECKENGLIMSGPGFLRFCANGTADHQLIHQSDNNEWYTPPQYIASVHQVLGEIAVDPASNAIANQTIRAKTIYTIHDDGFTKDWHGKVFLNPPYGFADGESNQSRWSQRLIEQYRAGITTEAILLVNAVPGNKWFAPLWDFPMCFVDHRIRFYNEATEAGQPTHSNVFVYLGPRLDAFYHAFAVHGVIAVRYSPVRRDDDNL
jgi:hypothetical protein